MYNIATEKCPECEARLCLDHRLLHGHTGESDLKNFEQLERKSVASLSIPDVESEPFSSLLDSHHIKLKDKIHALRVFNRMSSIMMENYLESEKKRFRP